MKKSLFVICLSVLIFTEFLDASSEKNKKLKREKEGKNMSFYDLEFKTASGRDVQMGEFKGKAVLIVNTATKCGFTPQLVGLQELSEKFENLVVIGFPCNQFLSQEPETNQTVEAVCKLNYGVTFTLSEKIEVNGKNSHPVFKYLKSELGGLFGKSIKWNFTKFLISKDGVAFKRYAPKVKPSAIEPDIKKLLAQ